MRTVLLALAGVLLASSAAQAAPPGDPDLIPVAPRDQFENFYTSSTRTFAETSCEVQEGMVPAAGTYRLLRFATMVANVGAGDLRIGNPAHRDEYEYAACHDHYHWRGFARYELMDNEGTTVVAFGHKIGFCFIDNRLYDPALASSDRPRYTDCDHRQGLQKGWADVYDAGLAGQWVITGTLNADGTWTQLPAGGYRLRTTINWQDPFLPDANPFNNVMDRFVSIPG